MKLILIAACCAATAAFAFDRSYECLSFSCDQIKPVPIAAGSTACSITIAYDQRKPEATAVGYKGDACGPTLLPAVTAALDLVARGQAQAGRVYIVFPSPKDLENQR